MATIKDIDSILNSVKRLLGINPEDTSFDVNLIIFINSAIYRLYQLGAIKQPYEISSEKDSYEDMMSDDQENMTELSAIKSYLYCRTRKSFDTPASSSVSKALDESIEELEWRIREAVDPPETFKGGGRYDSK